jgi:S1-C subfamily serine protease
MTHGIVSALNRQTNARAAKASSAVRVRELHPGRRADQPGQLRRPLVNLHGEVVGINTAIASRSGGFQGIGFAIPSNQAKYVYSQLKTNGKVTRGWLGVGIASVNEPRNAKIVESFGYNRAKACSSSRSCPTRRRPTSCVKATSSPHERQAGEGRAGASQPDRAGRARTRK